MHRSSSEDKIREMLDLYIFGFLEPQEAREVDEHLQAGCQDCRIEVASLEQISAQVGRPHPRIRERLLRSIASQRNGYY